MRRRDLLALLGLSSLAGAALLWRYLPPSWSAGRNTHIANTVRAIADLMFPGDGLPPASALGLHQRVLATPDLAALIAKGVAWLDRRAAAQGATDFLGLDETGRLAAVDAAFASRDDGTQQFVLALRNHIGAAYYSEPVVKAAFPYTGPPQPDGFPDFHERPA